MVRTADRRRVHLTAELRTRVRCDQADLRQGIADLTGGECDFNVYGFGTPGHAAGLGHVEALEVPPSTPQPAEAILRQLIHESPHIRREEEGAPVEFSLVESDGSGDRGLLL